MQQEDVDQATLDHGVTGADVGDVAYAHHEEQTNEMPGSMALSSAWRLQTARHSRDIALAFDRRRARLFGQTSTPVRRQGPIAGIGAPLLRRGA